MTPPPSVLAKTSTMKVPVFDLKPQNDDLRLELLDAVDKVLRHGRLILGPEVEEFEKVIAQYVGVRYAVGVASGSSALYLALRSAGVGPGDEVITTPLTWIITWNAIASCGATPVCVDVCDDFNINPDRIEAAITKSTKTIVPVHFTGQMCAMDKIGKIAQRHNLLIVEDAAQAFGAKHKSKMAGSFSKAAGFSMNPMKALAGYGEAGVVTTDDEKIYEQLRMLRHAGTKSDPQKKITNECHYIVLNHKIDTLQAAMLLVSMKHFPQRMARRTEIAQRYTQALSRRVKCPQPAAEDAHAYFTYAIQTDRRDELREFLTKKEIESKIFHIPLASEAPAYSHLKNADTPVARKITKEFLSLPAHEKLSDAQIDYVISSIRDFFNG